MKKCPYCGQEYRDGVSICTIDQSPLEFCDSLPTPAVSKSNVSEVHFDSTMRLHSVVTPFIGALLSFFVCLFAGVSGVLIFPLSLVWGMIVAVVALWCGERWRGLAGIGLFLNTGLLLSLIVLVHNFFSGWGC